MIYVRSHSPGPWYRDPSPILFLASRPIGFFLFQAETGLVMVPPTIHRILRFAGWLLLEFSVLVLAVTVSVWADTSSNVRKVSAGGCYCGCAQSKTAAGCGKMCELPKYASRWWAVTCAKPRTKTPVETPGAGPHFAHPPKAERASN